MMGLFAAFFFLLDTYKYRALVRIMITLLLILSTDLFSFFRLLLTTLAPHVFLFFVERRRRV
ncbi:hypothetical protein BDW02DRAFT_46991 [Decorospora gaudefroyi]|uniref:Uncharacterized protein n=1 Tax=Decorospora gaudefroyi TaxID=184978 RepID=A0A6A5K635_9PLEO|nr:hypothetical protein BDW02DRAFT_46991 [Decorospora gaudefroyi]